MKIAVLAVQGAFIEHEQKLKKLGASCVELRKAEDLKQSYDGLILPGGESTVQGKLLRELGMFDTLRAQILSGLPVLATCAGMILLADHIEGDPTVHFQTMPVTGPQKCVRPSAWKLPHCTQSERPRRNPDDFHPRTVYFTGCG